MELTTASLETARLLSMGGSRMLLEERLPDDDEADWQTGHRWWPSRLWERTLGIRATPTGEDAKVAGSEQWWRL